MMLELAELMEDPVAAARFKNRCDEMNERKQKAVGDINEEFGLAQKQSDS